MREYQKIYHIYAKDKCVYHSLSEEKFAETWEMLHRMVEFLDMNLKKEDLQYEEIILNKEIILNSSY
jgi:hypothetical protein